jgi:hypothetical protein
MNLQPQIATDLSIPRRFLRHLLEPSSFDSDRGVGELDDGGEKYIYPGLRTTYFRVGLERAACIVSGFISVHGFLVQLAPCHGMHGQKRADSAQRTRSRP